jgi:hypothetical protein
MFIREMSFQILGGNSNIGDFLQPLQYLGGLFIFHDQDVSEIETHVTSWILWQ